MTARVSVLMLEVPIKSEHYYLAIINIFLHLSFV